MARMGWHGLVALLLLQVVPMAATAVRAQIPTDTVKHLGVASCAGNNCHGAVEPVKNSSVPQNEYPVSYTHLTLPTICSV